MSTIHGMLQVSESLGRPLRSPAVAIGNFDGVHQGHQALLREAKRRAETVGGDAVALTFLPHPARYFAPALAPPMLTTAERKAELLHEHGADIVLIEPFTAELANLSPRAFVSDFLHGKLGASHVVVGSDFSFGKGREGTATLLSDLCHDVGMGTSIVGQVTRNGLVCSSTKIREFVLEGRVEGASMLLGRPFELEGTVITGFQRGRTLGFPTANLANAGEIAPKTGVYAGIALILDGSGRRHRAAISVGNNPTFADQGGPEYCIEAHLLDFSGDLYGKTVRLSFISRMRDQRRFPSPEALIAAIHIDIARTREIVP